MALGTKSVYVGMSAELIEADHIRIIEFASGFGRVIIGLLTDEAVASSKRPPTQTFEHRRLIVENLRGVDEVVSQDRVSSIGNLMLLKPDFVVHGDDWKSGLPKESRQSMAETLAAWGGELIAPRGSGLGKQGGVTPGRRLGRLRQLLASKRIVRALEAHSGLSGLIVEHASFADGGDAEEFDAIWLSSLTDSTAKGRPDIEFVDRTSRAQTLGEILDVTTKPIIYDGDTGGVEKHFAKMVCSLERVGVSAVIIEDKQGLKQNSLFGTDRPQTMLDRGAMCGKISAGKQAQVTEDFMVVARIESLIAKQGLDDALGRAAAYLEAGADGIMIHSKEQDGEEIGEFCKAYAGLDSGIPLISVPTSYNQFYEHELAEMGFGIVIYANHLLRSAYPAMEKTAQMILRDKRSLEVDAHCMSVSEILTLIPD